MKEARVIRDDMKDCGQEETVSADEMFMGTSTQVLHCRSLKTLPSNQKHNCDLLKQLHSGIWDSSGLADCITPTDDSTD